jgi:hypothetical protein
VRFELPFSARAYALDCHRIGGGATGNLELRPAEAFLSPPGISVLLGGSPVDAAADMRRVFGSHSSLGKKAAVVGTAELEQIRAVGFDVVSDPTKNFPNHGRLTHPAQGAAGFIHENLEKLSQVFTDTIGL